MAERLGFDECAKLIRGTACLFLTHFIPNAQIMSRVESFFAALQIKGFHRFVFEKNLTQKGMSKICTLESTRS